MTTLLANPSISPILLYSAHPPTNNGILLNHNHRSRPISSVTSSESSSSNSRSPSTERSPRRIRFAPLPEPRRDDGQDALFYPDDSDSDIAPPTPQVDVPPSPRLQHRSLSGDDAGSRSKTKAWSQKLLRPLLPSRKSFPIPANEASIPRVGSKDSINGNAEYQGGAPLARRMSTGNAEAERSSTYHDGAPLKPVTSEVSTAKSRGGQRLLNGRVYGRRAAQSSNNAQDSYEPEFVEWGYGGMGSVANSHAAASSAASGLDWGKVQSRGRVVGGGDHDDEDDGSGMAWIKRRRERKEREEREKAKAEEAQSVPEINIHPPSSPRKPEEDQMQQQAPKQEQHRMEAVSVPAPHHHHRHREGTGSSTPISLSRTNSVSTVQSLHPPKEEEGSGSNRDSLSGSSVDGEDEEDDEDTERDEDDEDDEDDSRITSKCAGVEKISRHKD